MHSAHHSNGYETSTLNAQYVARTQLVAEVELKRLGKPHQMGNGHRTTVQRMQAQERAGTLEADRWFWLIDYRDGNRRLLRRALTRKQAWTRNEGLRGSGRAWALCGE